MELLELMITVNTWRSSKKLQKRAMPCSAPTGNVIKGSTTPSDTPTPRYRRVFQTENLFNNTSLLVKPKCGKNDVALRGVESLLIVDLLGKTSSNASSASVRWQNESGCNELRASDS
jgi:hypothetical protein